MSISDPSVPAGRGRIRLDRLVAERGLADSRARAQALILAGQVLVDEQKVEKCGALVSSEAELRLLGASLKYASRAGLKLEGALDHFGVDPQGKICLDVGSSTGGFTDCLLQRSAARVIAVDVGTNQLGWKLRQDPRVVVHEKTNARYLTLEPGGYSGGVGHDGCLLHLGDTDSPGSAAAARAAG